MFRKFVELKVIEVAAQMLSLWLQPASQLEHSRTKDLYRVTFLDGYILLLTEVWGVGLTGH